MPFSTFYKSSSTTFSARLRKNNGRKSWFFLVEVCLRCVVWSKFQQQMMAVIRYKLLCRREPKWFDNAINEMNSRQRIIWVRFNVSLETFSKRESGSTETLIYTLRKYGIRYRYVKTAEIVMLWRSPAMGPCWTYLRPPARIYLTFEYDTKRYEHTA